MLLLCCNEILFVFVFVLQSFDSFLTNTNNANKCSLSMMQTGVGWPLDPLRFFVLLFLILSSSLSLQPLPTFTFTSTNSLLTLVQAQPLPGLRSFQQYDPPTSSTAADVVIDSSNAVYCRDWEWMGWERCHTMDHTCYRRCR